MLSILEPGWFWRCDVSEVPSSIFGHDENYPRGGLNRMGISYFVIAHQKEDSSVIVKNLSECISSFRTRILPFTNKIVRR